MKFNVTIQRSWLNYSENVEFVVIVDEEDIVANLPLNVDEEYDLLNVMKEVAAEYATMKLFKQGYLFHEGSSIELVEVLPVE